MENVEQRERASEERQVENDGGLKLNSSSGSGRECLNSGYFSNSF